MTSRDFCFWLQGYLELTDSKKLSVSQTEIIQRHLSMVFVHEIDPSAGKDSSRLMRFIMVDKIQAHQ